jgi:hypothetical protein
MDRAGEFVRQGGVHHPVALDAAFAGEGGGDDCHPEMRLALGPGAGVTGVEVGLVDHGQTFGVERRGEFFFNPGFDLHDDAILS